MPYSALQLAQLRNAMALLLPFPDNARPYLEEAEIDWTNISLLHAPVPMWNNILQFAKNNEQLDDLVQVLHKNFPKNPHILAFMELIDYDLGPDVKDTNWKEDRPADELEKITGAASTLLPISFLETGLKRAKAVARILIERNGKKEVGTGFLLANNLLLTNHHVIKDAAVAAIAKVQFDYEQSADELPLQYTEFMLDPATPGNFATDKDNDWTAVRIKGDANTAFGFIELKPVETFKDDFVNIIQHPGGRYKEVGMYHNIVTYCDNKVVQYLTDTEAGSSGSPVFNSKWEVVALHHSGGMLREPGTTTQKLLRNEGININAVIAGLKANNL